jgi:hypothetical protein
VALAAATDEARQLEAAIAGQLGEAQELEAAIAAEREEGEALRAQLGDLESQNAMQVGTNWRWTGMVEGQGAPHAVDGVVDWLELGRRRPGLQWRACWHVGMLGCGSHVCCFLLASAGREGGDKRSLPVNSTVVSEASL